MGQLTPPQLRRLEEHKYSSKTSSLCDPFLEPWWRWLVKQCPLTLAPNLITIIGLITNIVTVLILCYYSPDGKEEVPRWACFLCALGLFTYQSLDAIDGKQARRTGTASPLGELFDHGCDSVSIVFVALGACVSVNLGTLPYWMFFQCMLAATVFYCIQWETYVTGTQRFGRIDVTEAELAVMVLHIISGLFGSEFWSLTVPVLSLPCRCVPALLWAVGASGALFFNLKTILVERGAGRNGSTVAGTSVLSPVVPLIYILAPAVLIAWKSPENLYLQNPIIYLLTFGCVAARVTNRLVVAHMTKSEMAYTDASLLGPGILFLNHYFNSPIPEQALLYVVFAYVIYDLIKYCREVCLEICQHLNIMLFTIVPQHSSVSGRGAAPEKKGSSSNPKYMTRGKSKVKHN